MKREREGNSFTPITYAGQNNTSDFDGYEAYFGTYEVNEESGKVSHTLIGSVSPSNIGMTVFRDLRLTKIN